MPLIEGSSNAAISQNIRELSHAKKKRPRKQIIAIAMRKAGRSRKKSLSRRSMD